MPLTQQDLKNRLHYDPKTGVFTWRPIHEAVWQHAVWNKKWAGKEAGAKDSYGRIVISILKVRYFAHRLAWLYMHGQWPIAQIDHRDTINHHNWIDNLRDVEDVTNKENRRSPKSNGTSGFLGVSAHGDRWRAQIQVNKKNTCIGVYDTPEAAHQAYLSRKRVVHQGNTL